MQAPSAANSANAESRRGFFASDIGVTADSNPPYEKSINEIAPAQPLLVIVGVIVWTIGCPLATYASPAAIKIANGNSLASVNRLLVCVHARTSRMLINPKSPIRRSSIRRLGTYLVASGHNSPT